MNFQLSGEIVRILPIESGTSRKGFPYQNRVIVVRAFDKEQHMIALELKGQRVDDYDYLREGNQITAFFEIDSRSWEDGNGKERFSSTNEAYMIREFVGEPSEAQRIQDQVSALAHSVSVNK